MLSRALPSIAGVAKRFAKLPATAAAARYFSDGRDYDQHRSFYHADLVIQRATGDLLKEKPHHDVVGFGQHYADHMIEIDWAMDDGWHAPTIHPTRDLHIHPGSKCLHYAIQLFEGMKAYRGVDNKIRIFRPDMNMNRMKRTAKRAALPDFDAEELIKIMCELIRLDADWVPAVDYQSLYIRPTFIGTGHTLGLAQSKKAKLFVITGPAGPYFKTGFQPISLLADAKYVRAFPGGVGAFKMGSNYGPTVRIGKIAEQRGCQQVLWLSCDKTEEITEAGTMNIFLLWKNDDGEVELVTPPLEKGVILPGVTRQSLLDLARGWNEFEVSEKHVNMRQLRRAIKEKRVLEMFGAGTAAVVSPIGRIVYNNTHHDTYEDLIIPTMDSKLKIMQRFYTTMHDIHYGKIESNWMRFV